MATDSDSKLLALVKKKYNVVIEDNDYVGMELMIPVFHTVRKFDAEARYVHSSNSERSKVTAYLDLLWRYGEVDFRFNGTYVKIRQDEECTGYDFYLYAHDETGEYPIYIQVHEGNLKSNPFYVIDYIVGIIGTGENLEQTTEPANAGGNSGSADDSAAVADNEDLQC